MLKCVRILGVSVVWFEENSIFLCTFFICLLCHEVQVLEAVTLINIIRISHHVQENNHKIKDKTLVNSVWLHLFGFSRIASSSFVQNSAFPFYILLLSRM